MTPLYIEAKCLAPEDFHRLRTELRVYGKRRIACVSEQTQIREQNNPLILSASRPGNSGVQGARIGTIKINKLISIMFNFHHFLTIDEGYRVGTALVEKNNGGRLPTAT